VASPRQVSRRRGRVVVGRGRSDETSRPGPPGARESGLAGFAHHRPDELSGGQRQRVAVARALVTDPVIVLADEPTANLDSVTGETIVALMEEINRRDGTTFIFSTHDPRVMGRAHRVLRLADGRIEA